MADMTLRSAPVTWTVANQTSGAVAAGANGYVEFEATAVAVPHGGLTWLPSPQRAGMSGGDMDAIDLPINDPDTWNWKVTPHLGVNWPPFNINVPEDGVDLASAAVTPGVGPVRVLQGPQGGSVTGAEDQGDGTIRFVLDDGTLTDPMPITRGPAGPANRIQIGTVLRGDDPYASLTGAPPNQILNLVLPKGDPGGIAATFTETGPGEFTVEDGEEVLAVHAFAKDGTPSPGAQIALEAATPEWDNLRGRPAVFPPAPHTHDASDIIGDLDTSLVAPASGNRFRFVAGALRKSSGEWALIDDEAHTPHGIVSVADRGNDLRIQYGFTAKKVVSLVVTADESYAVLGYDFGASVGLDGATIKIVNHRQVSAGGYVYYTSDGWMVGVGNLEEVVERSSAHEIRVYHPEPVPADEIYLSITGRGPGKYIYRAEGSGTSGVNGRGYTNVGIYNMDGSPVTSFKDDMKLFVVRQSNPSGQVAPSTLPEGNTNIWVSGVMEV